MFWRKIYDTIKKWTIKSKKFNETNALDMMTENETKIVKMVYNRFIEHEETNWSGLDDNLELLTWLTDKEIVDESKITSNRHRNTGIRCSQNHEQIHCFAPFILESVVSIIDLYGRTMNLHPKNRYILSYYLVMSQMSLIFSI